MGVDNSKAMLAPIGAHLKGRKFAFVTTALREQETLAKHQEHKHPLFFLDMVIPETRGSETVQRLLTADNDGCVVMVSSMGTEETVQDCLKKCATSVLQKFLIKDTRSPILKNVCHDAGVAL
jgi:response regulator of citrate/malate metabolism